MSDERLQEAYARAVAARKVDGRATCPTPEAILALVQREGKERERLSVLDHVMACPACRDEFELLRSIDRAGRDAARAEAPTPTKEDARVAGRVVGHISWWSWAPLAAAAVIVLVLALGPGSRIWQRSAQPLRGGGDSIALIAPAEEAVPPDVPITFVWHAAAGVERYTLEILTSGGAVAVSRTTPDTTLTLALPPLAAGDYRWWVTATAADGTATRSGARTLRLRGR